jgi:arylformamidase
MIDPAMEGQYNNRANVPEHPALIAECTDRSVAWEADAKTMRELVYGHNAAETLDLFPAEADNAPIHMYIHGGYWQSNDKKSSSFVARPLVEAGAHVAVVDYGLCPDVTIDEIGRQCRAALACLWREAEGFGGNRHRITVSGHSCGGQLVGLVMATDWSRFGSDLPADLVKGGVSISGVFDLEPLLNTTINIKVGMDAETARRNSPLFMAPAIDAPLALYWGDDETDAFRQQSENMAAAWGAKGVETVAEAISGLNHFTVLAGMEDPAHPATRAIVRQLGLG